jgi:hypothetical protein
MSGDIRWRLHTQHVCRLCLSISCVQSPMLPHAVVSKASVPQLPDPVAANTAACWVSCVNFVLDDVGRLGFQMQDENSVPDSVLADTSGVMRCCRPQGTENEWLVVHFMSCPASKQ